METEARGAARQTELYSSAPKTVHCTSAYKALRPLQFLNVRKRASGVFSGVRPFQPPEHFMKIAALLAAGFAAVSIPFAAFADHRAAGVTALHQSVLQGLRTGHLSAREAAHLEREIDHVARTEAQAYRDGSLQRHEARRLEREHERARWAIDRQMRDGEFGDPRSHESRRMQAHVEERLRGQRPELHSEAHGWRR
jgi:hypothetical protein